MPVLELVEAMTINSFVSGIVGATISVGHQIYRVQCIKVTEAYVSHEYYDSCL